MGSCGATFFGTRSNKSYCLTKMLILRAMSIQVDINIFMITPVCLFTSKTLQIWLWDPINMGVSLKGITKTEKALFLAEIPFKRIFIDNTVVEFSPFSDT